MTMARVWDAIRKHQDEQGRAAAEPTEAPATPPAADTPAGTSAAPCPPAEKREQSATPAPAAPVAALAAESAALDDPTKYSELLVVHHDRGGAVSEEYRSLRTSLLSSSGREDLCFLVTSADPAEGKTVTTANLGLTLTERFETRTCIVDCDLRRGRLEKLFGGIRLPGVSDILLRERTLDSCLCRTSYENLFILPSGRPTNSEVGTLLGRSDLEDLFSELRRTFTYVVVDTPPMNVAADAGTLARGVDDALLVVRMNKTRRESVEKAIRLLHAANANISGVVLTHRQYHIPNYLYRYA
jgi:capsular exopolysaccharide synthesis family protein